MLLHFFLLFLFLLLRLLKIGFKFCCFQRHQSMTVLNFNPTSAVFIYKYDTLDGRPCNFCSGLMTLSCTLLKLLSLSGHFVSLCWVILSPKKFWQELIFFSKESCWQLNLPQRWPSTTEHHWQASFIPNLCYNFNSGFQLLSECYFWRLLHR